MLFLPSILSFMSPASAKVYLTTQQALQRAFPKAEIIRKTHFLKDQEIRQIEQRAKVPIHSKIAVYYQAHQKKKTIGYAFFDTHIIRTMPGTILVVVNPDGTIRQTELLAFFEPSDYEPPPQWLAEFKGRKLGDDLWIKRGVDAISGATLTAWHITAAIRKVLATYQVAIAGTP